MIRTNEAGDSQGNILCKACGLCCTGHLFIRAKLRSVELDSAQALGLNVIREPRQRGFSQPCSLWQGQCTIYTSPHYPRFCRTYKCKLLKGILDEITPLPEALTLIERAKKMIHEVEALLPASSNSNFRERLVAHMEYLEGFAQQGNTELEILVKAHALLSFYRNYFGVNDLVEKPEEE